MPNTIILEKVRLLRALLADVEMDEEDRELEEQLLREIEEETRK